MTNRSRLALLAILPALTLALVGCAPGGGSDGGAGGSSDGGSAGSSLNCDGYDADGYELFVDPRLTIDPAADVYSMQEAGDSISFTDTPEDGAYTTYSYLRYYINDGSVFPNGGEIFVGAEDTNSWTMEGPIGASGITGGPYAAIFEIEATTDTGTTVIARICATLAAE